MSAPPARARAGRALAVLLLAFTACSVSTRHAPGADADVQPGPGDAALPDDLVSRADAPAELAPGPDETAELDADTAAQDGAYADPGPGDAPTDGGPPDTAPPDAAAPDLGHPDTGTPDAVGEAAFPPASLTLVAPAGPVAGAVTVTALPEPADPVLDVAFFVDDLPEPLRRDLTPPFAVTLEPATLADGSHRVYAEARFVDRPKATAEVTVWLDNAAPQVTLVAPDPALPLTPPGTLVVQFAASDEAGLGDGSVQFAGLPAVPLPAATLRAELALPTASAFPTPVGLAYAVPDLAGNVATGEVALRLGHVHAAAAFTDWPDVVPLANGVTLVGSETEVVGLAPTGARLWTLPAPAGMTFGPMGGAAADGAWVVLSDDPPAGGVTLGRISAAGQFAFLRPDPADPGDPPLRYRLPRHWPAQNAFIACSAGREEASLDRLVTVDAAGTETPFAVLAAGRTCLGLAPTPPNATPQGVLLHTAPRTGDGRTDREIAFYDATGERAWSYAIADGLTLWTEYASRDLTAFVVHLVGRAARPVLFAVGAEGLRFELDPPDERMQSGLLLPGGDLLIQSNETWDGRLRRLRPDGTSAFVLDAADTGPIGLFAADDDGLLIVGDATVAAYDATGGYRWTWRPDPAEGPTVAADMVGIGRHPSGDAFVVSRLSAPTPVATLYRIDATGETAWREGLGAPGYATELLSTSDGTGLALVTHRRIEAGGESQDEAAVARVVP